MARLQSFSEQLGGDGSIGYMDQTKSCELCEAARFTEWYYEDYECWVSECEAC